MFSFTADRLDHLIAFQLHYKLCTTKHLPTIKMPQTALLPRESGEYIVKNAKYIKVRPEGLHKLTQEIIKGIQDKRIDVNNFSQHDLHPKPTDSHAVEWIFVVDTLNFCFWTPSDYSKYKVNGYTGYFALCAAINRALKQGLDITNAEFYSKIDMETVKNLFRSDDGETMVPLLAERLKCFHEVGQRLLDKWQGKFENVLKAANGSALSLMRLIVQEFPCFRDEANFAGKSVSLYKRAQILVGDIWACFRGEGLGAFNDLYNITMFADYRVPQVLVHFGSLEYTEELTQVLKSDKIMENGDPMEVEIRGASIYIVEQVKDKVLQQLTEKHPEISKDHVNSILIDHFLWDYRRQYAKELEYVPFHKVLSVYY